MTEDVTPVARELKFGNVDHGALRERLDELEAECQGTPALEESWIFDREGELGEKQVRFRLCLDRRGSHLELLGTPSFEGRVKVRSERRTAVADAAEARAIVEGLGYSEIGHYQLYREEWLLGAVVISLGHTPIGDFVEFEGDGCTTVAKRCGCDPDEADRRDYLRLYRDYRSENPEAAADMVFR